MRSTVYQEPECGSRQQDDGIAEPVVSQPMPGFTKISFVSSGATRTHAVSSAKAKDGQQSCQGSLPVLALQVHGVSRQRRCQCRFRSSHISPRSAGSLLAISWASSQTTFR